MLDKHEIELSLRELDEHFRAARDRRYELFVSKLALIELCGWTEDAMDEMIRGIAQRGLRNPDNVKYADDQIIKPTWGFEYGRHFRRMLCQTIGLVSVEKVELQVDSVKLERLKTALHYLNSARGPAAHKHIVGAMTTIDAPSVTKNHLPAIHEGLLEVERVVSRIGF